MYDTILIPIDGSDNARLASERAIDGDSPTETIRSEHVEGLDVLERYGVRSRLEIE